jgi:hypothetical protein
MSYQKGEAYYNDLYDLFTIKDCLRSEESAIKIPPKKFKNKRIKPISLIMDFITYYVKGERYRKKSETIGEWIGRDKEKDDRVENAITPENIYCDFCSSKMDMTMKHLHHDDTRVMFWFECPKCNKRKAIFNNGEQYKSGPHLCPKCSSVIKETSKRKGEVITTKIICPNCKYKTTEVMDFEKDNKEGEEEQRKDGELLEKYRARYCMTDQEGQEYIHHVESMKQFAALMKEIETKHKDPAYQKARKIKKFKVNDLKKKLIKVLAKEKYINLQFSKPEIERFVVIPFTIEDSDNKREEYDSRSKCKRIIKDALEKTNWRLMSEGIEYRLGYLTGKLKGYENEDDIAELFKKAEK